MSPRRRILAALAAPLLAAALSGCVSVLPKSDPAQLYSFGRAVDADVPAAPASPALDAPGVLLATVDLPRGAGGDGIMTRDGSRNAYIARSRWVGPAEVLFREAAERAFDRGAARARLISRGETGRTALILRLDVLDFEAVYRNGPDAAPTVVLKMRARLARPDGAAVDERSFEAEEPAADNRVGPIVDGYDAAVGKALAELVRWTDGVAAALPPSALPGVARQVGGPGGPTLAPAPAQAPGQALVQQAPAPEPRPAQ